MPEQESSEPKPPEISVVRRPLAQVALRRLEISGGAAAERLLEIEQRIRAGGPLEADAVLEIGGNKYYWFDLPSLGGVVGKFATEEEREEGLPGAPLGPEEAERPIFVLFNLFLEGFNQGQ